MDHLRNPICFYFAALVAIFGQIGIKDVDSNLAVAIFWEDLWSLQAF